ncbi:hypothetical protein WJX73_006803 [Symbiochloris irregularis]|uniref:Uncharacterized protein n=1 Tax=Symbiochloris irregularis TaxID=706552 RepID=A0AAW1PK17_9CHLO
MPPRSNKFLTAGLVVTFAAGSLSLPFLLTRKQKVDSNKPYTDQLGIRGAFSNSGSKDVGPDRPDNPAYSKGSR